jgi:hypothetical protein
MRMTYVVASRSLGVLGHTEHPLELLALTDRVSTTFMECAGAIQYRVELLDVERRRPAPVRREDP